MEYKKTPGEGGTEDLDPGLDRDYILAVSGLLPDTFLAELPWWGWAICVMVLVAFVAVLVRFS